MGTILSREEVGADQPQDNLERSPDHPDCQMKEADPELIPEEKSSFDPAWKEKASQRFSDDLLSLFFLNRLDQYRFTDYNAYNQAKVPADQAEQREAIEAIFHRIYLSDTDLAIRLLFYIRDIQGLGCKPVFRAIVRHLRTTARPEIVQWLLAYIPKYGTWKDVLACFVGTDMEEEALDFFANRLDWDRYLMLEGMTEDVSLAAKYAPSEKNSLDKQYHLVNRLTRLLKISKKEYRKLYLQPLRQVLDVVEIKLCAKEIGEIDYTLLSKTALHKYYQTFLRHDRDRFLQYYDRDRKQEKAHPLQFIHFLQELRTPETSDPKKIDPIFLDLWRQKLKVYRKKVRRPIIPVIAAPHTDVRSIAFLLASVSTKLMTPLIICDGNPIDLADFEKISQIYPGKPIDLIKTESLIRDRGLTTDPILIILTYGGRPVTLQPSPLSLISWDLLPGVTPIQVINGVPHLKGYREAFLDLIIEGTVPTNDLLIERTLYSDRYTFCL